MGFEALVNQNWYNRSSHNLFATREHTEETSSTSGGEHNSKAQCKGQLIRHMANRGYTVKKTQNVYGCGCAD